MAEITKELGRIPVSRGDYQINVEYYKDNIVQYKRGSYQVISDSPIIGIPPTNDKNIVNPGWTLFAGTLDAQDIVNQIKEQEAQSIQAVAAREAEILAKSDAAKVSFDNTGTSLSGTNVQDALEETNGKINQLKNAGYIYAGIATPTTNPGTPDGPVFYIATTAGSYSNFSNIEVLKGETVILKYNSGTWEKSAFKPMTDFNSVFNTDGKSLNTILSENNKKFNELNISVLYPTQGIDGTNKYDLQTAITQVPSEYRQHGIKILFVNTNNRTEEWEFLGGAEWVESKFIEIGSRIDNYFVLNYNTNGGLTRQSVKAEQRKQGTIICYHNGTNIIFEQYQSTNTDNSAWASASNWKTISLFGDYVIEYKENRANTRLQIQQRDRKRGLIITYNDAERGLVTERFKSDAIHNDAWPLDDNWEVFSPGESYIPDVINLTALKNANYKRSNFPNNIEDIYRKLGLIVTFKNIDTARWETYQYIGEDLLNWSVQENWKKLDNGIVHLGVFTNDVSLYTIRSKVNIIDRFIGQIITYKYGEILICEQYIGTTPTNNSSWGSNNDDWSLLSITNDAMLPWQGDREKTRLLIGRKRRCFGQTLCYIERDINDESDKGQWVTREVYDYDAHGGGTNNTKRLDDDWWKRDYWWRSLDSEPYIADAIDKGTAICITGASFVAKDENGWFELACEKLGVTPMNKAVSGTNIMDTAVKMRNGTLYTSEEFGQFSTLAIMHVHDKEFFLLKKIEVGSNTFTVTQLIDMTAEQYESNGIIDLFTDKTTGSSWDDSYYALAFDYVIKKYKSECVAANKPLSLVLVTSWNDGRQKTMRSIRRLAIRHGLPIIPLDITLTKNLSNTNNHPSVEFGREPHLGGNYGYAFQYGYHLKYELENGELPYAQKRMARLFARYFS